MEFRHSREAKKDVVTQVGTYNGYTIRYVENERTHPNARVVVAEKYGPSGLISSSFSGLDKGRNGSIDLSHINAGGLPEDNSSVRDFVQKAYDAVRNK